MGFQRSDHARSSNRIICKGRLARANSAGAAGDEELERGRCNQRKAAYLRQRGRGIEGDEASAGSPWFLDPEHAPVCIAVCRQGRACKAFVVRCTKQSVLQCCEGRATGNATDVRMDDSAETVRTSKLAQPSKINRSSRSANSANSAKELCSRRRCE